jgi:hypothetical protein
LRGGHGEHFDPDRGTKDQDELDQIHGQRRDSAATKQAERLRNAEIERIKNHEVIDPNGRVWTQEEMRDEKPHHERKLKIAEQFANERRTLQGLATRDTSLTEVEKGKFDDRMKWRNGRLVEKGWTENAAFAESARQQRAFIDAENRMRAFKAGPDSFEEAGYAAPDKDAPDYSAPKPATGFARTSIGKRRIARSELPKRRTLLELAKMIRETDDRAVKGAALIEAKSALDQHGGWLDWLAKETDLSAKTAQRLMGAAKTTVGPKKYYAVISTR